MRVLPQADPGTDPLLRARTTGHYLWCMARGQWPLLVLNMVVCTVWMVSQALIPTVLGVAIDRGIIGENHTSLIWWCLALVGLATLGAIFGTTWHRVAVTSWMRATFRTINVVGDHVVRTGPAMTRTVPTGEVVSVVASDAMRIANLYESIGQIAGAVISYGVVATILLSRDTTLGLIVLLGVPLVTLLLSAVLKPLQRRQNAAREAAGLLTTLGSDTVAGLRVLRGIGGEATFLSRYDAQSAQVLRRGCEVAPVHATLDAARAFIPGIFVVIVTWQGTRLVGTGALNAGDLVMFYGTAAFLAMPLGFATQFVSHFIRARIGAAKVLRLLAVRSDLATSSGVEHEPTTDSRGDTPSAPASLHDPISGVRIPAQGVTAVVTHTPERARAIADRLARFGPDPSPARWGGLPVSGMPIASVRKRIIVGDGDATLFTGRLRDGLTLGQERTELDLREAIEVASADDVVAALADGLDTEVTERGRSFSGGQRQRLTLMRALLTDAEMLVLIDPTSAVDAHTEARIASRLGPARTGRATIVFTTSPLLLEYADTVLFVDREASGNGAQAHPTDRVAAVGTHHDLLAAYPRYADLVLRGSARTVQA